MTYPSNVLFLLDFLPVHVKNTLFILLFNQAHEYMGFLSISKLQPASDTEIIKTVWMWPFSTVLCIIQETYQPDQTATTHICETCIYYLFRHTKHSLILHFLVLLKDLHISLSIFSIYHCILSL